MLEALRPENIYGPNQRPVVVREIYISAYVRSQVWSISM